jgi:hypothetical protein
VSLPKFAHHLITSTDEYMPAAYRSGGRLGPRQIYVKFMNKKPEQPRRKAAWQSASQGSFSTLGNLYPMAIHILPVLCGIGKTGIAGIS